MKTYISLSVSVVVHPTQTGTIRKTGEGYGIITNDLRLNKDGSDDDTGEVGISYLI